MATILLIVLATLTIIIIAIATTTNASMIGLALSTPLELQLPQPQSQRFLTYQNPDFHFRIQYPSSWIKGETNLYPHEIVEFHTLGPALAGLLVVTYQVNKNYTLADYAKSFHNLDTSATQLLSSGFVTLASGINAHQATYYDYRGNYNIKDMDTTIVKDGMFYRLVYRTEPGGFDANLGIAKQMVNSFQLTK